METYNFTFRAVGATEFAAKKAILRGWAKHRRTASLPAQSYITKTKDVEEEYGINTFEIPMNGCLRDWDDLQVS
jgi:hypothetical protein